MKLPVWIKNRNVWIVTVGISLLIITLVSVSYFQQRAKKAQSDAESAKIVDFYGDLNIEQLVFEEPTLQAFSLKYPNNWTLEQNQGDTRSVYKFSSGYDVLVFDVQKFGSQKAQKTSIDSDLVVRDTMLGGVKISNDTFDQFSLKNEPVFLGKREGGVETVDRQYLWRQQSTGFSRQFSGTTTSAPYTLIVYKYNSSGSILIRDTSPRTQGQIVDILKTLTYK